MAVDFHENRTDAESDGDDLMSLFHKVLGSCNINFLFGAGVNGGPRGAIPSFDNFTDTITELKQLGLPYADGIEKALQSCDDDNKRRQVLDKFVEEFNSKQDYSLTHPSLVNLQNLLKATHKAVSLAENRHPESKRVNVFTLNYDRIIEELLDASGFFNYALKKETKSFLPFDVVGYDTGKRAFVPTFAVYKLHGSVNANRVLDADDIVFPGQDKLGSVISNFYETLFAMKGELLRKNAALFVIGYSWSDEHINDAIDSAIDNGLTVMWPQYEAGDSKLLPDKLKDRVIAIPPANSANPCDTTATLANLFEQAMA
ncbi:SIR2 family protein [Thermophilibacter immobilis]|uniref:SIR2 family protein n=1 Tax=Thermophilibacter immobilis TaxID=2779519 RepID=A0A7S7MAK8_9ACTN|nr:SIR2 family protein [Thermophilibacter immobilis]QOY60893.1 SIR2 family protein [Thermophilibacter immobilis]